MDDKQLSKNDNQGNGRAPRKSNRHFKNRHRKNSDQNKPNSSAPKYSSVKNINEQNFKKKVANDQISENYKKQDFNCKCGECSDNFKMSLFLIGILESLNLKLNIKPEVIKGYVCEQAASKRAITKKSYHVLGKAVDFKLPAERLIEAFRYLEGIAEITGLGLDLENQFIHIDTREKEPQRWLYQKGEQIPLSDQLRVKYNLGEAVKIDPKDYVTA